MKHKFGFLGTKPYIYYNSYCC